MSCLVFVRKSMEFTILLWYAKVVSRQGERSRPELAGLPRSSLLFDHILKEELPLFAVTELGAHLKNVFSFLT